MEAGPKLDALMAEVMGWEKIYQGLVYCWSYIDKDGSQVLESLHWSPSTDMNAAMQVAEKVCNWDVDDNMLILKGQGPDIEKKEWPNGEVAEWWEAEINGTWGKVVAEADKPALAICLAVRKMKEMGR